jgi:hypothetical protein
MHPNSAHQGTIPTERNTGHQQAAMRLVLSEPSSGAPSAAAAWGKQIYAVWATPGPSAAVATTGDGSFSVDLYAFSESEGNWQNVRHLGLAQVWGQPHQSLFYDATAERLIVSYQSEESLTVIQLDRALNEVNRYKIETNRGSSLLANPEGRLVGASCSDAGTAIQITTDMQTAHISGLCQMDPWLHDLGDMIVLLWANDWPGPSGAGRDLFVSVYNKETGASTPPMLVTSSDFDEHAVSKLPGNAESAVLIWNQFDGTPAGENVQTSRTLFMAQVDIHSGKVSEPQRVENVPGSSLAPQATASADWLHLAWIEQGSRGSAVYATHCRAPCSGIESWGTPQRLGSATGATPPQFQQSGASNQLALAWVSGDPQSARLNTMSFNESSRQWVHSSDLPEVRASIDSFWSFADEDRVFAVWSQTTSEGSQIATAVVPMLGK